MNTYTVVLERTLNGSSFGTTEDEIEAASEAEAVETVLREWRKLEPRFTFAPYFAAPSLEGQNGSHQSG